MIKKLFTVLALGISILVFILCALTSNISLLDLGSYPQA